MPQPSVFILKVYTGLQNYAFIFSDANESVISQPFVYSPECMRAMRDFSSNIYPLATDKAKKDPYWPTIQRAVDAFSIGPDEYLAQFSSFYYLIKNSVALGE